MYNNSMSVYVLSEISELFYDSFLFIFTFLVIFYDFTQQHVNKMH